MEGNRDELEEAKRQIDSTVRKLRKVLKTLREKGDERRHRSQTTLAERRIRAFELASGLIGEELEKRAGRDSGLREGAGDGKVGG